MCQCVFTMIVNSLTFSNFALIVSKYAYFEVDNG